MTNYNVVLLYSKFSEACNTILEDAGDLDFIHKISIDNKKIRRQILNEEKLNINYVPCILVLYDNGTVEKYECEKAIEWVREVSENYDEDESEEELYQQPVQRQQPVQQQQPTRQQQPQHTSITNLVFEETPEIKKTSPTIETDINKLPPPKLTPEKIMQMRKESDIEFNKIQKESSQQMRNPTKPQSHLMTKPLSELPDSIKPVPPKIVDNRNINKIISKTQKKSNKMSMVDILRKADQMKRERSVINPKKNK